MEAWCFIIWQNYCINSASPSPPCTTETILIHACKNSLESEKKKKKNDSLGYIDYVGIYLEGGEHMQRVWEIFPPLQVLTIPSLESMSQVYTPENSTQVLVHVWFPPAEEPAIDNLISWSQTHKFCAHNISRIYSTCTYVDHMTHRFSCDEVLLVYERRDSRHYLLLVSRLLHSYFYQLVRCYAEQKVGAVIAAGLKQVCVVS